MNVKKIAATVLYLLCVAQTFNSAVPRISQPSDGDFAELSWKSAIRQIWKPAPQALTWVDSALFESKLVKVGHTKSKPVKPDQTKMKKYILCVCSRCFRAGAAPIRLQSDFDPGSIRPNPTNGEYFFMRCEK